MHSATGLAVPAPRGTARRRPAASPASLARLAGQQDGLFTRAQALACGFSAAQVRLRLRSGRWQIVLGPVLAPSRVRPTAALRDLSALLAVKGAVLAGPSAARRHGIPVADPRPCLIVRPGTRVRLPGVHVLVDVLPTRDVVVIGERPVTTLARTVFDCLRVLPDPEARELLETARGAGWAAADQLAEQLHRFAGRRGAKRLTRLCRHPADETAAASRPARLVLFQTERAAVELVHRQAAEPVAAGPVAASPRRSALPRFQPADLLDRPDLVLSTLRALLDGGE
jgi:hypothetical protein